MLRVFDDLRDLFQQADIGLSPLYEEVAGTELTGPLAYTTPLMHGVAETVFSSKAMIAFNLVQNSIDEAKGAARISIIAGRYADGPFKAKMRKHVSEELKHSRQFLRLMDLTGLQARVTEADIESLRKVLDFDDELPAFICRVHSIEIRSWTMLRIYIELLEKLGDDQLAGAIPVLREILSDEIGHVLYTGQYVVERLEEDPAFADTLHACMAHTNRETWQDVATMAAYLADNFEEALAPAGSTTSA